MMTTSSAFSIPPNKDPFYGQHAETLQMPEPEEKEDAKTVLLKEYIEKFLKKEITEKELNVIRKTLE